MCVCSDPVTYNISDVVVDILKETVALGEGSSTVLDKVKCPQLSKRRQKLLDLVQKKRGKLSSYVNNKNMKPADNQSEHHKN